MLAGVYGPPEKMPVALNDYYGLPVRLGASRFEATTQGKRAIGTVNGRDVITVEIKSLPGECQLASGRVNYPGVSGKTSDTAPVVRVADHLHANPPSEGQIRCVG